MRGQHLQHTDTRSSSYPMRSSLEYFPKSHLLDSSALRNEGPGNPVVQGRRRWVSRPMQMSTWQCELCKSL